MRPGQVAERLDWLKPDGGQAVGLEPRPKRLEERET